MASKLTDMSTWNGRTGQDRLRSFTDEHSNFWLEQNPSKTSKWAEFASNGHDVAWEFGSNRRYTGRMLIDGGTGGIRLQVRDQWTTDNQRHPILFHSAVKSDLLGILKVQIEDHRVS